MIAKLSQTQFGLYENMCVRVRFCQIDKRKTHPLMKINLYKLGAHQRQTVFVMHFITINTFALKINRTF
jgi:hypothetical protein